MNVFVVVVGVDSTELLTTAVAGQCHYGGDRHVMSLTLRTETEEELSRGNTKCSLAAQMKLCLPVSCHDVNFTKCMT